MGPGIAESLFEPVHFQHAVDARTVRVDGGQKPEVVRPQTSSARRVMDSGPSWAIRGPRRP